MPFRLGFSRVYSVFAEHGIDDRVVFMGAGKLGMPDNAIVAFALGCDMVYVAREAMLSIGCIQAQKCHTDTCPVGVATQNKWLAHSGGAGQGRPGRDHQVDEGNGAPGGRRTGITDRSSVTTPPLPAVIMQFPGSPGIHEGRVGRLGRPSAWWGAVSRRAPGYLAAGTRAMVPCWRVLAAGPS